jgi:hypothetical protein
LEHDGLVVQTDDEIDITTTGRAWLRSQFEAAHHDLGTWAGGSLLKTTGKRLSLDALVALPRRTWFPPEVSDPLARLYALSGPVLLFFAELEWFDKYVLSAPRSHGDYLLRDWRSEERIQIHMFRIILLAEMLFNLQHVAGFDQCMAQMKARKVESTYTELEVAKLLRLSGRDFVFNEPIEGAAKNFDIFVRVNGIDLCVDAKCKAEKTDKGTQTVLNTLKKAHDRNLPDHRPGAIFVKIPQEWANDAVFFRELEPLCRSFFGNDNRVTLVHFHDAPILFHEHQVSECIWSKTVVNVKSRFWDERFRDLIVTPGPDRNGWVTLMELWAPSIGGEVLKMEMSFDDKDQDAT